MSDHEANDNTKVRVRSELSTHCIEKECQRESSAQVRSIYCLVHHSSFYQDEPSGLGIMSEQFLNNGGNHISVLKTKENKEEINPPGMQAGVSSTVVMPSSPA